MRLESAVMVSWSNMCLSLKHLSISSSCCRNRHPVGGVRDAHPEQRSLQENSGPDLAGGRSNIYAKMAFPSLKL